MNLRRFIREEMDEWEWAKEILPHTPITELHPNTRYKIVELTGRAYKEYMEGTLKKINPFNTVFVIDNNNGFTKIDGEYSDYYQEGVDYVWVQTEKNPGKGDWIPIDTIMVTTFI
jgi:hypothetical protein